LLGRSPIRVKGHLRAVDSLSAGNPAIKSSELAKNALVVAPPMNKDWNAK